MFSLCLFFIQGVGIAVDEFYFHYRRGLDRWERISHPIDTFLALSCYTFLIYTKPSIQTIWLYLGLASLSCVLITKDEWEHAKACQGGENWLHAVLFMSHPLALTASFYLWWSGSSLVFIKSQAAVVFLFFCYQVLFWRVTSKKINNAFYDEYGERWYSAVNDPVALLRAESKTKTPWVIQTIQHFFQPAQAQTIADIGCGAGFLTNALALEGHKVTGVDLSSDSLRVAQTHDQTKTVRYLCADAYHLPLPDKEFDVVTCMDFLEHVEDPQAVISECARILKPGGLFIFHTFNRNWLAGLVIIKLIEWFIPNTPKNMHVLRLFITPKEFKRYCAQTQLQVLEMKGIRPIVRSIPLKAIWKKTVPEHIRFKITSSTLLSYIGSATK